MDFSFVLASFIDLLSTSRNLSQLLRKRPEYSLLDVKYSYAPVDPQIMQPRPAEAPKTGIVQKSPSNTTPMPESAPYRYVAAFLAVTIQQTRLAQSKCLSSVVVGLTKPDQDETWWKLLKICPRIPFRRRRQCFFQFPRWLQLHRRPDLIYLPVLDCLPVKVRTLASSNAAAAAIFFFLFSRYLLLRSLLCSLSFVVDIAPVTRFFSRICFFHSFLYSLRSVFCSYFLRASFDRVMSFRYGLVMWWCWWCWWWRSRL
ncbi:hypothetical protein G7K_3015-t1 [Saitoella complicata NRRL Y-17804]|uniref:Uncharacterized protein n=1 Tax=Saitoella complicata (strain BCRC 22490 / CBS 7301 / JCM 7358 / NBRC 10748 / NRRL Y-17804) TaxID=698492 RepID=A0A0E9NG72_SAICN|nr:hypothetical protein G7K_3015-t1 [Saitoella complicata NRRL Y-17804]